MVIRSSDGTLRIEAVSPAASESSRPGDVSILVDIQSCGFSGRATVWLGSDDLDGFVRQLETLERARRGTATLRSLSPGALDLQLKSVNARGGMAVEGRLEHSFHTGEARPYRHGVSFGFEFDPFTLPEIVAFFREIGLDNRDD